MCDTYGFPSGVKKRDLNHWLGDEGVSSVLKLGMECREDAG